MMQQDNGLEMKKNKLIKGCFSMVHLWKEHKGSLNLDLILGIWEKMENISE